MSSKYPAVWTKVATSLKVAALVTVLGSIVLAATPRMHTDAPSEGSVAASKVEAAPADSNRATSSDYFPAQFAAPSGPVAEQPPTF